MPVILNYIVNLAAGDAKPVEVLRTGSFVDMHGTEVEIDEGKIDQFVINFETGQAGQDVPIDIRHRKDEAAGWVKRLWRDGVKLMAEIEWNNLGRELVGDKVYKYLSASYDAVRNMLTSISLVNFPAVKGMEPVSLEGRLYTPTDVPLSAYFQARIHQAFTHIADAMASRGIVSVEQRKQLSIAIGSGLEAFAADIGAVGELLLPQPQAESVYYFSDQEKEDVEMAKTAEQIRAEERARIETEMAERQNAEVTLRAQIRKEERELAEVRYVRRQELVQFADEVCAGGLSVKPETIIELMEDLENAKAELLQTVLRAKVVSFQEQGSGAEGAAGGDGEDELEALPEEYAAQLRSGELKIADLSDPIILEDLKDLSLYDLSEFQGE